MVSKVVFVAKKTYREGLKKKQVFGLLGLSKSKNTKALVFYSLCVFLLRCCRSYV